MTWLYSDQWAAGFFDGEGCITVDMRRDKQPGSICAQTTQKMKLPLSILQNKWGGTIDSFRQSSPCFRWRLSARQAEAFLTAIYPHSLVKRRQIEITFAYLKTMGKAGTRTPETVKQMRRALIKELADEKRNWGN